jgi:hypothetical protein
MLATGLTSEPYAFGSTAAGSIPAMSGINPAMSGIDPDTAREKDLHIAGNSPAL